MTYKWFQIKIDNYKIIDYVENYNFGVYHIKFWGHLKIKSKLENHIKFCF